MESSGKIDPIDNRLRQFKDLDDLFDHVDSATILEWVNKYWDLLDSRRGYHRKYQAKKQMIAKVARKMLDSDELALIERQAAEAASLGGEPDEGELDEEES